MATRLFAPVPQFVGSDGRPISAGTLTFYATGTSTLKDTYSDSALTSANANPLTLDASGRPSGDIFLTTGTYKVVLKDSDGTTIRTFDPVEGAPTVSPSSAATVYSGVANRLHNGDFRLFQRGFIFSLTSAADDAYHFDRWYSLNESGSASVSQLTAPENGQSFAMRLTQPDVSGKRIGFAQIVEAADARSLRGQEITLGGRVRISTSTAIRYAILEWTGTADTVTSDVVNNWASGSYTAGGFFNSTTIVVAGHGTITPSAATWTDLSPLTATISGSANNLIVVFWTSAQVNQNVTFDAGLLRLALGDEDPGFQQMPITLDAAICSRYFQVIHAHWMGSATNGSAYKTIAQMPLSMRAAPTCSFAGDVYAPTSFGAAATSDYSAANSAAMVAMVSRTANATAAGEYYAAYGLTADL